MEGAKAMGYRPEQNLYEALFATPENRKFAWPDPVAKGKANATVKALGENWFVEKALFEEYAQFGRGHHHDLAEFDVYFRDDVRGLRWPVVNGKETKYRFVEGHDPYVKAGEGFNFYGGAFKALPTGNLDDVTEPKPTPLPGKAKIFFRPYAAPVEQPDKTYDLWLLHRPHPRALAHRLDDAARGGAQPRGALGGALHAPEGRRGARRQAQRHRRGSSRAAARSSWWSTPRAATSCRAARCSRPSSTRRCSSTSWCSTPWTRSRARPDFKKCAVKVTKA